MAFGVTYLAHAGRGAVYTCPKCLVRRRARDAIELVRGGAPWCDHHCRNFKRDGWCQCLWTFICPSHVRRGHWGGATSARDETARVRSLPVPAAVPRVGVPRVSRRVRSQSLRDTTLSLAALTLEKTHYLVSLTDHMLITQMGDAQLAPARASTLELLCARAAPAPARHCRNLCYSRAGSRRSQY